MKTRNVAGTSTSTGRRWATARAAYQISAAVFGCLAAMACADASRSGLGADCAVVDECMPGLACVPQKGGKRICTNDLSSVQGDSPKAPEAKTDGSVVDSGSSVDAGGPEPDAAPPPRRDASSEPVRDAAPPLKDAGPSDPPDAGGDAATPDASAN